VSLSPSITRPFDAPEFLFTARCRHPARGHCFARVSYTVSTLPFWPNFGDFTTPRFTVLQVPIARRSFATPEEVLHAHIWELDHALQEALDRLTEADHRIFLMEAKFTRFRDIKFSPLRARVAAMESLNTVPSSGIPVFQATQEGYPKQEMLSH
jgi:hypothetical protein